MCGFWSWVDGEESRRKIKVAIRPLSPTNAAPVTSNVEDIRASVQGLSLSPTAVVSSIADRAWGKGLVSHPQQW